MHVRVFAFVVAGLCPKRALHCAHDRETPPK
jgi:hypothetical protein